MARSVEPMATETYKTNVTFDFNPWSLSDEEGMVIGYDSSGNTVLRENCLTVVVLLLRPTSILFYS
jgi:hypothetical protein